MHGESRRQRRDKELLPSIKAAFEQSEQTYGAGRIGEELCEQGTRMGKNRIRRLMRESDLKVKSTRRFKVTTNSDHKWPVAPTKSERDFPACHLDALTL